MARGCGGYDELVHYTSCLEPAEAFVLMVESSELYSCRIVVRVLDRPSGGHGGQITARLAECMNAKHSG